VPVVAVYVVLAVLSAPLQRRAVTILGWRPVPDPHRSYDGGGAVAAVRVRLRELATWREAVHAVLAAVLSPLDVLILGVWAVAPVLLAAPLLISAEPVAVGPFTLTTPTQAWAAAGTGVVVLVLGAYAVMALAGGHATLVRVMLGPYREELYQQVTDLTRSRLRLIDAFDVERRRIERDLHDGAQQQLVALAMTLDLAQIELEDATHPEAARLVSRAHEQATATITGLRELIHGIHPPVLTELGLPGAVRDLVDRSPLPVHATVNLPRRLAPSVESAAYFVLAEALTNAGKHSRATQVRLGAHLIGGALELDVVDDGVGGADPTCGTGLVGLGDRVAVVGGRLTLSSPPGGPTTIRATIPDSVVGHHT